MNELKLYEISDQYQSIFDSLYDPETGEITEEGQAKLDSLDLVRDNKCVAVASVIRNMESDLETIKFMKEKVKQREELYKKRMEKLEWYLKSNMEACGVTKINNPLFDIKLSESFAVDDDLEEYLIPDKFKETEVKVKVLKSEIRKALMKGEEVPGAKLKRNLNLSIK